MIQFPDKCPPLSFPAQLAGKGPVVFAMGTFDGLHRGHQAVLAEMIRMAEELHALPAVLFFDPCPRSLFTPGSIPMLMTPEEKCARMAGCHGARAVIRMDFTFCLAALSPDDFMERFFFGVKDLEVAGFVVGTLWRFGRENSGDVAALTALAQRHGAIVSPVRELCTDDGAVISSTRIRQAIAAGDCRLAGELLGRPYTISGTVGSGRHLATDKLSCPTANIDGACIQLPPYGVYAARTRTEDTAAPLDGIVYIGNAPTFRPDDDRPIVELHLFNFQGNLYNRRICIEPVEFLRTSRRFPTPEALRQQITLDIQRAKAALAIKENGKA